MQNISLKVSAEQFELREEKVKTATGEKKVVYRAYTHIPYVQKPVDLGYQSLDIHVPVSVDGVPVDPSGAPMLILIGVGGYTAIPNDPKLFVGPPRMGDPEVPGGPSGPAPVGLTRDGARPIRMPQSDKPFGDTYDKAGTDSGPKALAEGWVVVIPGVRGHDNKRPDGTNYGKAPASIVDLKAVVRFLRENQRNLPGDTEKIFASGGSAAGALASLMAVSGNDPWYEPYLEELGAAKQRDDVFGCLSFCPITDLGHADGAYEYQYGPIPATSPFNPVPVEMNATISETLTHQYSEYIDQKGWTGRNGFGTITGENFKDYILREYLVPSCNRFLREQADPRAYLKGNPWISYDGIAAAFTFEDFVTHTGRSKTQPAFDDLAMEMEPAIFGTESVNARHFTDFGQQLATGDPNARIEPEVAELEQRMNAMYYLPRRADLAQHWWIRHGSCDKDTSLPIIIGLATALENEGVDVNVRLIWDGGHGADDEKFEMIDWIRKITAKHSF